MAEHDLKHWSNVVQAILAGDKERFKEIVMAFQDGLRFVITYRLRCDAERSDEILHCTFVEAYKTLRHFDCSKPLEPWLKQIAQNLVMREFRNLRHSENRSSKLIQLKLIQARLQDEPPHEKLKVLNQCLKKLKNTAHKVVQMHYFQGLGFDAISQALGTSAGALRSMMFKTRQALRDCVEKAQA